MASPFETNRRGPSAETAFQPEHGYARLSEIFETAAEWVDRTIGVQEFPDQNLRVRFYRLGERGEDTLAGSILNRNVFEKRLPITRIRYFNTNGRIDRNERGIAYADFSVYSRGWIRAKLSTNDQWYKPEPPDANILQDTFFYMYRLLGSEGTFIVLEVQRDKGKWEKIGESTDFYDLLQTREKESMPQAEELKKAILGIQAFGKTVFDQAQRKGRMPGASSSLVRFRDEVSNSWAEINVLVPLRGPNPLFFPLSYADSDLYHSKSISRIRYDVSDGTIITERRGRNEGVGNVATELDPEILKKMWKMMRKKDLSVRVLTRSGKLEDWDYLDLSDYKDEWCGKLSPREIGDKYEPLANQILLPPPSRRTVEVFRSRGLHIDIS